MERPAHVPIPVLDLDTLSATGFVTALQASSCVFVTGGDVPVAGARAVHEAARRFFNLPDAEKQEVAWSGQGAWQGWQRMTDGPVANLIERFELRLPPRSPADPPLDQAGNEVLAGWAAGFALWPASPPGFVDTWTRTYAAMHLLSNRLIGMVAEGLEMDTATLDAWTTRQWSNLVVNHYPPQPTPPEAGRYRSQPHTDIGGFTILWSDDTTGGLEARLGPGRSWVPVHFPPDALLIQAGDLLTRWTGGRIPSNIHRVVNPPPGTPAAATGRFSVVYFHHPDMETTITGEDGRMLLAAEHVRRRQRLETPLLA